MTARKRRGSLKFLQPCEALPLMLAFELPTISLWNENAWRLYLFFKKKKGISFTVLVARLHSLKASHINGSASPGLCAREWITMLISAGFVRVQRQLTWRLGRVDTMPSRQPTCPPLRWCCADKITNKRFLITITRWKWREGYEWRMLEWMSSR